jgi:hypothetical protein
MAITPQTVTTVNDAVQGIPLPDVRIQELPVELNQLQTASVGNRARLDFDADPSDFRRLLHATKS